MLGGHRRVAGVLATAGVAAFGSAASARADDVLEVKLAPGTSAAQVREQTGGEIAPLVTGVATTKLVKRARAVSGRAAPDMAAWYRLTLPAGADAEQALMRLRATPGVTYADPAPEPAPPPSTTPDFTSLQTYLRPAPQGIDADFSRADPRARGAGIKIADLEYYWNSDHEDLQLTPVNDLGGTMFPQYTAFGDEHGTAVFGEMAARDNGYGVTGGVPDASMNGISPTRARAGGGTSYVPAAALTYVAQFLSPGDAVLLEQQAVGPNGGSRYVPLEWTKSAFDAIKMLSDLGVVVVETGGNGGENLDQPAMQGAFDRSVRDSGAILVGAGSSTDHAPLGFSSWGSRVDLQGYGQNVVSTGFNGNLFGGTAPENIDVRYTRSFSGTSSAGPIVTDAVVAVESYLKASGQGVWPAQQVAGLLERTGTPQGGDPAHHVGPLPNLSAALKAIEVDAPTTTASVADSVVTLTADDGWGSGVDRIEYRIDGGAWTAYTQPFSAAGAHTVDYRAIDRNANTEDAKTLTFVVDTPATAGGTVPATLALTLGAPASFGAFTPGVTHTYTTSTTVDVTSTAGDATLTASDPGRLTNGAFTLAQPLRVQGVPQTWDAPVSNDVVTLNMSQDIGAGEALRTGTYATRVTLTLSTTTP